MELDEESLKSLATYFELLAEIDESNDIYND